ncbi:MAG: hypothetical protein A3B86_02270 [Candidatus Yanofskybacteria bacterium RIFCSPHIGHO2_02_FULL_38_22b]|uniref:DUF2975 domain-containing protein n=1 Tax=Candidatus Yanofskybacteria bacterium RIFCSPHIGHO2_02_FULL_38_22b TaxID=1802673 RepID=A0A1F8F3D4_9BACT|nr:MAG: hypothetical protein A3B86_02270 [Candidatus Yanofskybacteria bacterium RIFCSPHIGHO2_02_FULL_38_22b]OGN20274.1 MAG: hypothetical protein A2910_03105 [Candidatus Yanofskybacteria bacterium RIFCSPLOWO2_01_FULL_39_28]
MKKVSTNFLRFVIFLLGIGVLALCIFALPGAWKGGSEEFPTASCVVLLIVMGIYITAAPFLILLWQALKLLNYIDHNKAFSDLSVKALRNIKYCASIIAVVYVVFVPLLIPVAEADDAPGLVPIGLVISFIPIAVAIFAAVLQRLFQNAIDIKSENDLTV